MYEVKALILCNNPISVPGIKEFLFYGNVAAIATTKRNKEMQHILNELLKESGVPLLIIDKKKSNEQIKEAIATHNANVVLMMTFPFIISKELLSLPEKGFINFHYGLLPNCRGPQPILWHLLNNDEVAGVTIHVVDEGVDTGPIVMQEKIPINDNDTYGLLQTKLAFLAAKQAANLLKILSFGKIIPAVEQEANTGNYYEMPTAKELTIDWKTMDAKKIIRLANACNPWNKGAGTQLNGWIIGVTEAEIAGDNDNKDLMAGTIFACDKENGLLVKTIDNKLLRLTIIYTNEGFFSGGRLKDMGVQPGLQFS